MPTERIYSAPIAGGDECDLILQWQKAQDWHEQDNDEGVGHVTLALESEVDDPTAEGGIRAVVVGYAALDRTAINRLVEKIRRARNQAYGEDR